MNKQSNARSALYSVKKSFPCSTPNSKLQTPNSAGLTVGILLTAAILIGIFQTTHALAISGRDVYEKVHEQRSRSLDRKTEVTMVLFDKGGGKRTRTLTEYGKKSDPDA